MKAAGLNPTLPSDISKYVVHHDPRMLDRWEAEMNTKVPD